jgi:anti-anti-sigma factor
MRLAELNVDSEGQVVCASLHGEVDMSNAAEFRSELNAITPNTALGVILDLTEVNYLDSAGIHFVHRLREDLRASGQKLQLVVPQNAMINATLSLAGVDWSDDTADSVAAARERFDPPDSA